MKECIHRILSPEMRAFDAEQGSNDRLDPLDSDDAHHAAYLGCFNLLLSFRRTLDRSSEFIALHFILLRWLAMLWMDFRRR
ncbi:MAG: hypothetical protein FJ395_19605 [Verrucomicrobia bacterium]|nr:hypothetical protein [Verrucomicrobiota bacterium]